MGNCAQAMKIQWIPGVVSATFKKMPLVAPDVISLMRECNLQAVEWSENVHVMPDDPAGAAALGKMTRDAGLTVAAYGSYFRLGENKAPDAVFSASLRSAAAMGAPVIRVWAGTQPSADTSPEERKRLAKEAALIASLAQRENIKVAFEWHKNTLTDTNESAMNLLREADHPNLFCLWQPTVALSPRERTEGIRMMGDRLLNFHVYSWPDGKRGPLNAAEWQYYFDAAKEADIQRCALLEFVRDDSVEQFRQDTKTLLNLLESGEKNG